MDYCHRLHQFYSRQTLWENDVWEDNRVKGEKNIFNIRKK